MATLATKPNRKREVLGAHRGERQRQKGEIGCVGLLLSYVPALAWSALAGAEFAFAHEAHKAECNETTMNATKADIQAMDDGAAKTTALQEMQMAEEMMAKNDMGGCTAHMHKAMEAMEE
jgi:hypothetical protein